MCGLAREGNVEPYIQMLSILSRFTAGIDFSNLAKSEEQLEACNAFKSPNDALLVVLD